MSDCMRVLGTQQQKPERKFQIKTLLSFASALYERDAGQIIQRQILNLQPAGSYCFHYL